MKNKWILFLFLLVVNQSNAMDIDRFDRGNVVKLPSEEILIERFRSRGLGFSGKQTGLIPNLANRELQPMSVVSFVDSLLHRYLQNICRKSHTGRDYLKYKEMCQLIDRVKPQIYEALLQERPDAIEALKRSGHIQEIATI